MRAAFFEKGGVPVKKIAIPDPVLALLTQLESCGFGAWAVGGCVRDSLLGRIPGDWDICTTALPEQTMAVFLEQRTILTGAAHGTVTVIWEDIPYEITTLRAETGYADHRHPDKVEFVKDLRQDLARRDFTVNAMACGSDGAVVDIFGGREDLAAGIIRCVGEPTCRFEEDALRILRALRFSAQLRFSLEDATVQAAEKAAHTLGAVSAERIYAELNKLLVGPGAAEVLRRHGRILAAVIPEIGPTLGFDQKKTEFFAGDLWEHTVDSFAATPPDRVVRWAMLLHDLAKVDCFTLDEEGNGWTYGHEALSARMAEGILRRLRADNATRLAVVQLIEHHGDVPALTRAEALHWLRLYGREQTWRLMAVKRGDLLGRVQGERTLLFLRELDEFEALLRDAEATGCWNLGQLAVTGGDLMAAGWPKGPTLGRGLNALLDAVMAGQLANEKQALLAAAKELLAAITQ